MGPSAKSNQGRIRLSGASGASGASGNATAMTGRLQQLCGGGRGGRWGWGGGAAAGGSCCRSLPPDAFRQELLPSVLREKLRPQMQILRALVQHQEPQTHVQLQATATAATAGLKRKVPFHKRPGDAGGGKVGSWHAASFTGFDLIFFFFPK